MTMSDPIADMLTRIRNANTAKHDTVDVPASKMKKGSNKLHWHNRRLRPAKLRIHSVQAVPKNPATYTLF